MLDEWIWVWGIGGMRYTEEYECGELVEWDRMKNMSVGNWWNEIEWEIWVWGIGGMRYTKEYECGELVEWDRMRNMSVGNRWNEIYWGIWVWGIGGMRWTEEYQCTPWKICPITNFPTQILPRLLWYQTRASEIESRRFSAWDMARLSWLSKDAFSVIWYIVSNEKACASVKLWTCRRKLSGPISRYGVDRLHHGREGEVSKWK